MLENENAYGGIEFEVTLPAGVTLSRATISNRLNSDYTLQTSFVGENTYKVLLYNTSNQTFSGNDGTLLYLVLSVDDNMVLGDYEVKLSNIVASGTDSSISDDLNDRRSVLHVKDYMVGDATGDAVVNVTDILAIANYILKIPMTTINEQAADVSGDGRINVTDIMAIANIILKINPSSNARTMNSGQLDPQ